MNRNTSGTKISAPTADKLKVPHSSQKGNPVVDRSATVFKICPRADWIEARERGAYLGSADDRRDGFIHLSAPDQLAGTLERHFAVADDLVLVAFASMALGASLRWEFARNGHQYPHLYGTLPIASAQSVTPLLRDPAGAFVLPEGTP